MVELSANLVGFLRSVHTLPRAAGVEELARLPGMPDVRSIYRWHDAHDDLVYFPSVAFGAFGLVHAHVFIDEPRGVAPLLRYAIRAQWVVRRPGSRTLYLHCLLPPDHLALLDGMSFVRTGDGAQVVPRLGSTAPRPAFAVSARDLVERYPLVIPVVFECVERRISYPALWETVYERLGEDVWQYLPRFSRRLRHNGKTYVAEAFRLLSDAMLVSQHVVRCAPLVQDTVELVLVVRGAPADAVALLASTAAVEVFPTSDGDTLVRAHAGLEILTQLFSATLSLEIVDCWFVDRVTNERSPLPARFAYETLFDPRTATWRTP